MAAATPLRIGADNQGADKKALFLKVYGGMVITAFRRRTAFTGRHIQRNISSGKSAQFPRTSRVTAKYHVPGTELTGQDTDQSEAVITLDDMLVSDVFIPEIDELMTHFGVRSEYAAQQGEQLANIFDMNVARMGLIAARSPNPIPALDGGEEIVEANALTDADAFAATLFTAQTRLAEKNVPDSERYCFVKPDLYFSLVSSSSKAIHKDYGGEGSYAGGTIIRIAGLPIVMTNNLPTADDSANTALNAKYRDDFSTTASLVMHRSAVGTLKLKGLSASADWDVRRLGTLLVARYAVGHGVLRPESSVEIKTAAPVNQVVR